MKRSPGRKGATALEFALLLPVIFTCFSGTVDGALYFYQRSAVVEAAASGARAGAVSAGTSTIDDDATDAVTARLAASGIDPTDAVVSTTTVTTTTSLVEVSVTVPFTAFVGLIPMPSSLAAVSTTRYENTSAS